MRILNNLKMMILNQILVTNNNQNNRNHNYYKNKKKYKKSRSIMINSNKYHLFLPQLQHQAKLRELFTFTMNRQKPNMPKRHKYSHGKSRKKNTKSIRRNKRNNSLIQNNLSSRTTQVQPHSRAVQKMLIDPSIIMCIIP